MTSVQPRHHNPRDNVHRLYMDLSSQTTRRPMHNRSATYHGEKEKVPWEHMARTYEWVLRHDTIFDDRDRKTERWIMEQQIFMARQEGNQRTARLRSHQDRLWEDTAHSAEIHAKRSMRQEDAARQRVLGAEVRAKLFEEETRRIEARIRHKLEAEKRKLAEERHKAYEELRKRERQSQLRAEKLALDAWNDYEAGWIKLSKSSELLNFSSIPWPVLSKAVTEEDIKPAAIASFLLSPAHSKEQTPKERIRSAQLRWHPDRFQRVLRRIKEEDKGQAERCVGVIARSLNDMTAREATRRW